MKIETCPSCRQGRLKTRTCKQRGSVYWKYLTCEACDYKCRRTVDKDVVWTREKRPRHDVVKVSKHSNDGFVYAIQDTVTGHFKIGRSLNVRKRLVALQTSNPHKLKAMWKMKGGAIESLMHKFLRHWRMEGEWFNAECLPVARELFRFYDGEIDTVEIDSHGEFVGSTNQGSRITRSLWNSVMGLS